ncbi:hypothetical protein QR680_017351 [Steinernema hermaphroditum]|uniref:Helicase ATP-binding domain-containing protein n=1 Tax=Steinernema hermaphroditum TaxID=289476 RepID=A0AA39LP45_9BILA|nr:hypothetical protein QR680_017351 [Steinernema hermaphroditum]
MPQDGSLGEQRGLEATGTGKGGSLSPGGLTTTKRMVTTRLHGIDVQFPYEPYECQNAFMEKVIEALNREENAALESPTGTGKTLSLLCSALAWLQNYKGRMGSVQAEQLALNIGSKDKGTRLAPQVIYASRTHSQLAQVVRELNKTTYKTLSVTTIASRDQLCIHEKVAKESDNKLKAHMCRALAGSHKCHYFNNWEKDSNVTEELYRKEGRALDIEDLVTTAKQYGHCPFYQSRSMKDDADLILLPYNYILDPRLRNSHKIQLKGNIVIFDEAHNLESVCEDSTSVCFSSTDLAHCMSEAQEVLKTVMEEIEAIREQKDNTTELFGQPASKNIEDELNVNDIAQMIILLEKILEEIDNLNLDRTKQEKRLEIEGRLFEGSEMAQLLERAGFRPEMREPISLLIDRIGQFLSKRAEAQGSVFAKTGKYLQEFASFVATVTADSYEGMQLQKDGTIAKIGNPSRNFYLYAEKNKESNKRTLNYWCFSAGVAMRFLQSRGVRSIIITSGTLSPLNHFISTMGIPFGITLENGHVATPDQICAGSLNMYFNYQKLDGTFENRSTPQYKEGIGTVIVRTVEVVPQGVLVFFPSYSQMMDLVSYWKTPKNGTTLYEKMLDKKKIFIEPRSKAASNAMFTEFDQEIRVNSGATMFAVVRGRMSEGIDFADTHCRAVVIVGIPYPPFKDTKVILKKHFLHEARTVHKVECLTPEAWYRTEGVRAVNQAIGRIIRHKNDFGAVILADPRYSRISRNDYPSWMRNSIKPYDSPGAFFDLIQRFFRDRGLACETSLRDLRQKYEASLAAQRLKADGLVTCRKRKVPQSFQSTDDEANKRYATELKGLYQNFSDASTADLETTAVNSAMKLYTNRKTDSNTTMKEDFVGRSDTSDLKQFFKSLQPRSEVPQPPKLVVKRTIKLKANSRVCDVNSPSIMKTSLDRYVSQGTSNDSQGVQEISSATCPSTSAAFTSSQIENQPPEKASSSSLPKSLSNDSVSSLLSLLPVYSLADYAKMIRKLPVKEQKSFVVAQMDYTKTSNLVKLLDSAHEILLPKHPDIYKGLFGFLQEAHKKSFAKRCSDLQLL